MESVHLLQSRNYKLYCSVGDSKAVLFPVRAVLDTGADPNLVREDILPKDWERWRVPNITLPRITNASAKQILAKGAIVFYVQLGTTVHRVRFYVAPGLAVPCILGCKFINLHVKAILPKEKKVEPHDGASVAIANESDSASKASTKEPAMLASTKFRAAPRVVIPHRCEAQVAVQTAASELCLIQNRIRAGSGQGLSLANGIAEVRPQVPFKVRVINSSHQERIFPNGMVLGVALPHPDQVVSHASDGVEAVNTEQQSSPGALISEKMPCEGNAATTPKGNKAGRTRSIWDTSVRTKGPPCCGCWRPQRYVGWAPWNCDGNATSYPVDAGRAASPCATLSRRDSRARRRTRRNTEDASTRCHRAGHVRVGFTDYVGAKNRRVLTLLH
jgi:Retroviral aspartyl protease